MKYAWQDVSSYSRGVPVERRVPSTWEMRTKLMRIAVHRHIDYPPDTWLVSVNGVDIKQKPLVATDQETAKLEALSIVRIALARMLAEISDA